MKSAFLSVALVLLVLFLMATFSGCPPVPKYKVSISIPEESTEGSPQIKFTPEEAVPPFMKAEFFKEMKSDKTELWMAAVYIKREPGELDIKVSNMGWVFFADRFGNQTRALPTQLYSKGNAYPIHVYYVLDRNNRVVGTFKVY